MNKLVIKKCIICNREFECNTEGIGGRGSKVKSRRRVSGVTCSKGCSKIYKRIYQHFNRNRYQQNNKEMINKRQREKYKEKVNKENAK